MEWLVFFSMNIIKVIGNKTHICFPYHIQGEKAKRKEVGWNGFSSQVWLSGKDTALLGKVKLDVLSVELQS